MKKITRKVIYLLVACMIVSAMPINIAAAKSIKLSKKSVTLYAGETKTIKLKGTRKKPKWSSSKKSVATISKKGKIKAKKQGTAVITAKLGKKKYKCKVKVKKSPYRYDPPKVDIQIPKVDNHAEVTPKPDSVRIDTSDIAGTYKFDDKNCTIYSAKIISNTAVGKEYLIFVDIYGMLGFSDDGKIDATSTLVIPYKLYDKNNNVVFSSSAFVTEKLHTGSTFSCSLSFVAELQPGTYKVRIIDDADDQSTNTTSPTASPRPTASPTPTALPKPTASLKPTASPTPTALPKPTASLKPTASPISTVEGSYQKLSNYIVKNGQYSDEKYYYISDIITLSSGSLYTSIQYNLDGSYEFGSMYMDDDGDDLVTLTITPPEYAKGTVSNIYVQSSDMLYADGEVRLSSLSKTNQNITYTSTNASAGVKEALYGMGESVLALGLLSWDEMIKDLDLGLSLNDLGFTSYK